MKLKIASIKSVRARHSISGQTLVIAIIILAVLLILGIGFAALLNQNIKNSVNTAERNRADDYASAGVQYSQYQLLNSIEGADWRPAPTSLGSGTTTKDPDVLYLRPGSGQLVHPDPVNNPTYTITDKGGPDFLGPYSRVTFQRGRSLIRVRYGPEEYKSLVAPNGGFSNPGKLRNSIIIESVGKPGVLEGTGKASDPTLELSTAVQFSGFTTPTQVEQAVGKMKGLENGLGPKSSLYAVATLGLTEYARSIWNKFNDTRPAEIGFPTESTTGALWFQSVTPNILYEDKAVSVPTQYGSDGGVTAIPADPFGFQGSPGGGGFFSNADVQFNGSFTAVLNQTLGEGIQVVGKIKPANDSSSLTLRTWGYDPTTHQWLLSTTPTTLSGSQLDSDSATFSTVGGQVRDGSNVPDANGDVRGITRREPPSFTSKDPQSGVNRYDALSKESGILGPTGVNTGEYGFGQGVYIDSSERGNQASAADRIATDAGKTLPNDWMNPNNSDTSGWKGPFYIARATYIELFADGFSITRDSQSNVPNFTDPATGAVRTDKTSVRYYVRIYNGTDPTKVGKAYIVDDLQAPSMSPQVSDDSFIALPGAREFNGIVETAGDVRVRGVIPTNVQMSIVSRGSIYIEGSITKGVVARDSATGVPFVITAPTQSLLMLAAKDYVALNTTMFFGPEPGQTPQANANQGIPNSPVPVAVGDQVADLRLQAQMLLDPTSGANPSTWQPYALTYQTPAAYGTPVDITSSLMMQMSANDDGPSFSTLTITPRMFNQVNSSNSFLFPALTTYYQGNTPVGTEPSNDAAPFFAGSNIPAEGLATAGRNAFPVFQTESWPLIDAEPAQPDYKRYWSFANGLLVQATGGTPLPIPEADPLHPYSLAVQDETTLDMGITSVAGQQSKSYFTAHGAIAPYDIRIEASIYAEEGSFFVIPGQWFNTNPDDTRLAFEANIVANGGSLTAVDYGSSLALAKAQITRYETFNVAKETPFYGEPLDVRITIVGALAENMPASLSQQTEWLKKWGWIPQRLGGSGKSIPAQHSPNPVADQTLAIEPNLTVVYDGSLASAGTDANPVVALRKDANGNVLPPIPHLPVSPTLSYFGEKKP